MLNTTREPTDYLTIPGIRVEYGFSRSAVYVWMKAGLEPEAYVVDGVQRRPMWLRSTVEAWLADPARSRNRPKKRAFTARVSPPEE